MCLPESSHIFFLRVDLMTLVFNLAGPNFDPGLDLIQMNILTKFHKDCIKTVPSEVYTWFS